MSPLGTLIEPGTLRIERTLPAPIERVWAYLADPGQRALWLAGGTMSETPGSVIQLRFEHTRLTDQPAPPRFAEYSGVHVQSSRVVRVEPPRLLVISWGSEHPEASEVTFELSPQGDRTLLVLTHRRLPDAKETLSVASGWHAHLDVLADTLAGGPLRPFWTNLEAAEEAYRKHLKP